VLGTSSHELIVQAKDADGNIIFGAGSPSFTISHSAGALALTVGKPPANNPSSFSVTPPSTYSSATATLSVNASYAGQATNGCAQPGAVCSASVVVDMKELIAVGLNNAVDVFALGSTTPYATLSFGIANPTAILFDRSGNLIVSNCLQGCSNTTSIDNIAIFAPPYTGVPNFITNGIVGPMSMALDSAGNLFVGNCSSCRLGGTDTVTKYAPPFSNSSSPVATANNGITDPTSIAVDHLGNLWVANCFTCVGSSGDTVTSYASPYSGAPTHTLLHNVSQPSSVTVDSANDVFVANMGTSNVADYVAPSYTDNSFVPLIATIGSTYGGNGSLASPVTVLSAGADVWVADNGNGSGAALRCGPPFQSATPNCGSDIVTVMTSVNGPSNIAIDGAGNLFVANSNANNVTLYAPPSFATATTLFPTSNAPFAVTILP
jgi:hypothetical protein